MAYPVFQRSFAIRFVKAPELACQAAWVIDGFRTHAPGV